MKASQLAKLLLEQPGDPEVYVQNGYDPSDWDTAEKVRKLTPEDLYGQTLQGEAIGIES